MAETEAPNIGDFVIVQRQSFMKLHKLAASGSVKLGKALVLTDNILGKPYWTTYRMESKKDKNWVYDLVECSPDEGQCQPLMKDISSGLDNRNILDDGSGQKLSSDEIVGLRDEGLSSREIVGTLIENSTTFQEKTEYSQEKYLKKKEKKYFEYITIRKPIIRLIADIMYKLSPSNIMGLRSDTLSQLATAVNLHPHGKYIIYESGCQSIASAFLLNGLSSEGRLVVLHPGSNPQKQAIQALNLNKEEQEKVIYVNILTFLRRLRSKNVNILKDPLQKMSENEGELGSGSVKLEDVELKGDSMKNNLEESSNEHLSKTLEELDSNSIMPEFSNLQKDTGDSNLEMMKDEECFGENNEPLNGTAADSRKRKYDGEVPNVVKKPRYQLEADRAISLFQESKADGLVIVCREHPANILKAFLPHIGASRNFVVYGAMREPLQELSLEIRKRPDVVYVQLSEMWLRNYQIMENRTHPFVNMSGGGGYLLTGIVIE